MRSRERPCHRHRPGQHQRHPHRRPAPDRSHPTRTRLPLHARLDDRRAGRDRSAIHTGEVIADADGDLFGRHVILAARIANEALGGEILVSSLVREIIEPRGDVAFGDARTAELKGLDGNHTMYPILWD